MAGTIHDDIVNDIINASVGDGTFSPQADSYLMLLTSAPTASNTIAQLEALEPDNASPAWTDYARVQLTDANFDPAALRNKNYGADVDFGTASTGGDVDVAGWAIVNKAAQDGTAVIMWVGTFATTKTVQNSDPVKVPSGNLDIGISSTLN